MSDRRRWAYDERQRKMALCKIESHTGENIAMVTRRFFCLCVLLPLFAFAGETPSEKTTPVKQRSGVVENKDCEKTKTCDLKRVTFTVENYGSNSHQGTRFIAGYETVAVGDLENYLFVQFIRGCVFTTAENRKTGEVETRFDSVRRLFGKFQLFVHKDWDIDSSGQGGDPAYYTNLPDASKLAKDLAEHGESYRPPKSLRHFFYMWNDKTTESGKNGETVIPKLSTKLPDDNDTNFFGLSRPKNPLLFVDDEPSGTTVMTISEDLLIVRNISLEFKMCLYKTGDVPVGATPKDISAQPIVCIPWHSSFVFNHAQKEFESPPEIAQACRAAPDPSVYSLEKGYPVVPYFAPSR